MNINFPEVILFLLIILVGYKQYKYVTHIESFLESNLGYVRYQENKSD